MTATPTPIEIPLAGRQWRAITPFGVTLGGGVILVLGRIDLEPDSLPPAIFDRWPDAIGDPVRVILPEGGEWLGKVVFVDRFRPGRPEETIRVYVARG